MKPHPAFSLPPVSNPSAFHVSALLHCFRVTFAKLHLHRSPSPLPSPRTFLPASPRTRQSENKHLDYGMNSSFIPTQKDCSSFLSSVQLDAFKSELFRAVIDAICR